MQKLGFIFAGLALPMLAWPQAGESQENQQGIVKPDQQMAPT
jgi:hypothetical protein